MAVYRGMQTPIQNAENTDSFPALVITVVNYLASDADVRSIWPRPNPSYCVPHRVYRLEDGTRVTDVQAALEIVFRQCNHVDGSELISGPEYEGYRSLSVGDVVTFCGPGGWLRVFVCEGLGWTEITVDDRDWLLENISPRDYFGTFAEVKARNA
jgi:hypothetical protein